MDPRKQPSQEQELRERIVPSVRASRGFVRGAWSREIGGDRSTSFIVFDDEASAREFMYAVRANTPRQSAAGVTNEELLLVELVAEA
jgi:hypothetical protein